MTVQGLINKLEKIKKAHGPRTRVTLDLEELKWLASFGIDYSHWELNCIDTEVINWAVDDSVYLRDGTERLKLVVVLS